jgi:hypothetical protein
VIKVDAFPGNTTQACGNAESNASLRMPKKITKKRPALPSKPEWPKDWGLIGLLTSRFIE